MVPGHRTCHIPVYPLVHTAVFRISDLCQLVYVILWVPDDSVVCLGVSRHGAVVLNMYHALACPGEFRSFGVSGCGRKGRTRAQVSRSEIPRAGMADRLLVRTEMPTRPVMVSVSKCQPLGQNSNDAFSGFNLDQVCFLGLLEAYMSAIELCDTS